jgi:hypothetical protein
MATTPIDSPVHKIEQLDRFFRRYPLCRGLKIEPVNGGGFDIDDVSMALGPVRFALLTAGLKSVFCCAHRKWPMDHSDPTRRNAEVHCVWAVDLEEFLKAAK